MDAERWFRLLNVVLAFAAFIGLGMNMYARRRHINRRTRRVMLWVYAMLGLFAYGSWVNLLNDKPLTPVTVLVGVTLVGLLLSLLWHPEGDGKTPPDDGSLGQMFIDAWNSTIHRWEHRRHRHYRPQ